MSSALITFVVAQALQRACYGDDLALNRMFGLFLIAGLHVQTLTAMVLLGPMAFFSFLLSPTAVHLTLTFRLKKPPD
jgi:hypothetical protein